MTSYLESTEQKMKEFYNTLNEKDRRLYAAIEALKLGHGGITYISKILGCDRKTISKGIKELEELTKVNNTDQQNEPENESKTQVDKARYSINDKINHPNLPLDLKVNHDTPHREAVAQSALGDQNQPEINNDQESETIRNQDKQNNSPTSAVNQKNNDQKQSQCDRGSAKGNDKKKAKKCKQRVRKSGAGRKSKSDEIPSLDQKILDILANHTAGDPMKEGVIWTNLSAGQISELLKKKHKIPVSLKVIRKILKKHGYSRRKAKKSESMKKTKNRNEQFENIARLKKLYENSNNPIISMDTKKKENLGNFYRDGKLFTLETLKTWDHDFKSFAHGVVIPHGIYDWKLNIGYVNIGVSKDTSEFACDSLRNWWNNQGRSQYSQANSIFILCDGGGSNHANHYLFKQDLQKLAEELGLEIRIAHYPPYTSKYNPIEHRMFPHITRACQGVVFESVELVKELIECTTTKKGLTVTVEIINKVYQTGRKYDPEFKKNMPIIFDQYLPKWNYRAGAQE